MLVCLHFPGFYSLTSWLMMSLGLNIVAITNCTPSKKMGADLPARVSVYGMYAFVESDNMMLLLCVFHSTSSSI